MSNKQQILTEIVNKRRVIQIVLGVAIYYAIHKWHISLWWVVGFGSAIGIIWGKVFCRWMCPLGIMMEFMMKLTPNDALKGMYQYHKIGCPIAWISGMLNKVSFYKIKLNADTCKDCGLCDNACYMPTLDNDKFSLYKPNMVDPASNYSCSKCLECVSVCPNGSLTFKVVSPFKNNIIDK